MVIRSSFVLFDDEVSTYIKRFRTRCAFVAASPLAAELAVTVL